ncbi:MULTISPECIES: PaaI family thioesterase [unclassified Sphingomonas]|uniref:PaaI family thioesterase n=1 Tax=unclassified Sphingomonas TaxID=196159 RepID=UPI000700BD4C|nr:MULTISPECIES: PaaI family thioesterase [unclassified Sphingomonas]KQM28210.1 phenylacetic acid degradation protein [Sphingomonas sp. Leaf9]KQM44552.1 phenylacetic acid degradation protein [Sphingomonas sp. Leaf11]KQM87757.1 phenylacetic acid degradation protein [Sphingomonas sp. Leaf23]
MTFPAPSPGFDPARFFAARLDGHGSRLGIGYQAHGADWCELLLPFRDDLIGDPARGVLASGPIVTLMDMATSVGVWLKRGAFLPHATLDLRLDYLRPATPGRTVVGRGECYRVARQVAFVRGIAHDGDPHDPVAHVAGTFMLLDGAA